jgi:hypothetical protein
MLCNFDQTRFYYKKLNKALFYQNGSLKLKKKFNLHGMKKVTETTFRKKKA